MAGRPSSIHGMPGASSQLNPTEELDKLEQSITLTLQEIDQNFNQCHRIVTHSIMPIIERYTEQSRNVNDGARFWKQFFEFSANVSIGSYETRIDEEETTVTETEDQTYDSHDTINTTQSSAMVEHPTDSIDDSILPPSVDGGAEEINFEESSTDISTPRPPPQMQRWANLESPYETLRKELNLSSVARSTTTAQEPSARKLNFRGMDSDDDDDDSPMPKPPEVTMFKSLPGVESGVRKLNLVDDDDETETFDESSLPTTPDSIRHPPGSHRPRGRMLADTPETARKIPGSVATTHQADTAKRSKNDILLHRAVDTNWRLQATPLVKTPKKSAAKGGFDREDSDSPFSSPQIPQITTVLPSFNTPPGGAKRGRANSRPGAPPGGPKTPTSNKKLPPGINFDFDDDDDDDDDDDLGFSPPVTMQFTLPPSKLLQTPAKEASRRLVRDIMQSAGLDPVARGAQSRYLDDDDETTTTDTTGGMSLDSPTNLRGGEPTDAFADY